jgi:hypothetical protein
MRLIKWSVLAVGEGDAEKAFLDHLKASYISRNCGVAMTNRLAYGKGARNVVNQAIRYARGVAYSRVLALADTDTDYDVEVQQTAEDNRIILLPSSPCFEALLLRLHGEERERTSAGHKDAFEARFGGRVQDPGLLEKHFPKSFLEQVRDQNALIHQLINTLGVRREP